MELHYSITPAHIQALIAEPLKLELLKHEQQQARAMASVALWQKRLVGPLMFALCLIGGMLALYFPERRFTPESTIAMGVFALVFIPLWWRFSGRWIKHLQARIATNHAKPRAPLSRLNKRLIEAKLKAPLKFAEGDFCLSFDEQGFTLGKAGGTRHTLAWDSIVRLQETPDFYLVACAVNARQGAPRLVAKHSDRMPAEDYQQGLQAFLSQCPVAPSDN